MEDTEFVKAGAYHTIEIEPNRPFEVTKQIWDALDLERIQQACDPAASADLAVLLITVGLALGNKDLQTHQGINASVIANLDEQQVYCQPGNKNCIVPIFIATS